MNWISFKPKTFASAFLVLAACTVDLTAKSGDDVYRNPDLPMDVRIRDLISRLTLDEKAELMRNESPGVPRIGIPEYDWWNEALHGVARAGEATVFPQAIGLAAMWDEDLMLDVADVISTEARAKHHEFVRNGIRDRYTGLTFWSPNINIFRDPRWGRGQETYGEDPFLTGRMGAAFVKGLQGDDPKYLKTAATAKHFAVHSGPEPNRYSFNADPTAEDFYEIYLPAFEVLVKEAKVESVMSAYNALFNVPTTMSPVLYDLLDIWGFDGHVVSDCGAVYTIFEAFGLARDFPEAEALAMQAGLCLRCGDGAGQLGEAVRRGLITEDVVDEQLFKLLRTWFRLGMFDPVEDVAYAQIPYSENDTKENSDLALKAAERSLVLLKNEATLPLDRSEVSKVLVVGPNANSIPVLLGNYNGTPSKLTTIVDALRTYLGEDVEVDFTQGCDYVEAPLGIHTLPRIALTSGDYSTASDGDVSGLIGSFYANGELSGEAAKIGRSHQIDFDWSDNPPVEGADAFSIRWKGFLNTGIAGDYRFLVDVKGGVRLKLGDQVVIDHWETTDETIEASLAIAENSTLPVSVEYRGNSNSGASVHLKWETPAARSTFADTFQRAQSADVVLFFGGISAQLEGEDMRVDYEGFGGGDRSRIELPDIQQELVAKLSEAGKPIVFVNLSGSAMAFETVDQNSEAILQAWYPGQRGGEAIARVLFGESNPSGRLPVTFYESTSDLPDFEDYRMQGRTYRFFEGDAAYAFGHGLSYTEFEYGELKTRWVRDSIEVTTTIRNIGDVSGNEVVQVYLTAPKESGPREIRALAAFENVFVKKGKATKLKLSIGYDQLKRWNESKGAMEVVKGDWRIEVGASSGDIRLDDSVTVN